ncbi:MAG: peptidase dimerization domain-containing protein [Deltaproteobacteria bacterium]|jgi:acetylornithine deacetylase/succinyl-diaminopimelate desuccinylase-like protein|nr:peptidase dimerization domain-containing protein [Deltaproteobacteria bacterium]
MDNFLENLPALVDEVKSLREIIITNIVLIGQTPAPTFREKRRSKLFMDRLAEFQVDEVTTDGYRNPIGIIRGSDPGKAPIFVLAHLDTFFDKDHPINYTIKENTITGPGLLDNSLGVGVITSLPAIFKRLALQFESDIVLAGTIQSIGKGNLRGVRHLLKTWPTPIRGGICIEGVELGRLNYFSDGMIRGEIHCSISGERDRLDEYLPNAIIVLNEVMNEIMNLKISQRPRSRIVIGKIRGGANHGKIATEAALGFEIRSDSYKMVKKIFGHIKDIVEGIGHENEVDLNLKTISNLRASRLKYDHPLVKNSAAVMGRLGIKPFSKSTESALSIFLSQKIPAVTLGITHGENVYKDRATMKIEPMYKGIAQVIGVLKAIDSGVCDEQ